MRHADWHQLSAVENVNPADPVSGFAGIPRNMTGMATKLKEAGYVTHAYGKVRIGTATGQRAGATCALHNIPTAQIIATSLFNAVGRGHGNPGPHSGWPRIR